MNTNLEDLTNVLNATANLCNGIGTVLNGVNGLMSTANQLKPRFYSGYEQNGCILPYPHKKRKKQRRHQPNCKENKIEDAEIVN
jgi:hypothetical protein